MGKVRDPRYFCGKCGEKIGANENACRHCGADLKEVLRRITIPIEAQPPPMQATLKAKQRRPGIKKAILEILQRSKIAGASKRPADESFTVDRTGENTKVVHKVQELEEHGKWITVHKHEKKARDREFSCLLSRLC